METFEGEPRATSNLKPNTNILLFKQVIFSSEKSQPALKTPSQAWTSQP